MLMFLKIQIIFFILICILDFQPIILLFFHNMKIFFDNKIPLVTEKTKYITCNTPQG